MQVLTGGKIEGVWRTMVFSSHIFLFYFLPIALLLYFAAPRRAQHLLLTLLSCVFYGWANPLFVPLMLCATVADYVSGLVISGQRPHFGSTLSVPLARGGTRSATQRAALVFTIGLNLSLLAFFKYFHFGVDSYNAIVSTLGWDSAVWVPLVRVTLPLGISFWTFHAISYVVDVYRGDARAVRNYIDYACYVSMFPQLVAGPIIRFQDVADQLASRTVTSEKLARGICFFCFGLAKKVLLANPCGQVADMAFDADGIRATEAWAGVISYAFQIYFDFSGYSDMAIGLALMLGFVFAKNFDSPYHARSITEFWRRWHLSLSTWLRDYVYVPLGGNRHGSGRTYVNLLAVMLVGGLWHGASWTFVVWGFLHGMLLCIERLFGRKPVYRFLPAPLMTVATFVILCFTWVFFRAATLPHALAYCTSLLGAAEPSPNADLLAGQMYRPYYLFTVLLAGLIAWAAPQTWDFTRRVTPARAGLAVGLLWVCLIVLSMQSYNPFIYFMF